MSENTKNSIGAPSVFTEETLQKLKDAFLMGCTDTEAALFAGIAVSSIYNYQRENPDFLELKRHLKENPKLKARLIVYKELDSLDKETAKWYLERKAKDEFSTKQEVDNTNINLAIDVNKLNIEEAKKLSEVLDEFI